MKIMMVGRGVVATIYGWALSRAGNEVTYLVRPGQQAALGGRVDLDLLDARVVPRGRAVVEPMTVDCTERLDKLAEYDLVVVGVRHHQLRGVAEQLRAAPRPKLGVLFFNNCWEDPANVIGLLKGVPTAWGFPYAGGEFVTATKLVGALLPTVNLGAAGGSDSGLQSDVRGLFESAGFKVKEHADFRAWLWLHFAATAGMLGQAIALGSEGVNLLSSARNLARATLLSREALRVVYARGVDRRTERSEFAVYFMPAVFTGLMIKQMARRNPVMRRFMTFRAQPRDVASFPLAVLKEAARLKVPCPRLSAIERHALDAAS
jgi:2-dehydropantoate 2-reductase